MILYPITGHLGLVLFLYLQYQSKGSSLNRKKQFLHIYQVCHDFLNVSGCQIWTLRIIKIKFPQLPLVLHFLFVTIPGIKNKKK